MQFRQSNLLFPQSKIFVCLLLLNSLAACSTRVTTENSNFPKLDTTKEIISQERDSKSKADKFDIAIPGERYDAFADELAAKECLKAWRIAIAHDEKGNLDENKWQKQRQLDEKKSIEYLESLSSRYPQISYIKTMMGQVKQHFNKPDEAAAYYEEALLKNRKDPLLLFKVAKLNEKAKRYEQASSSYRELLTLDTEFLEAKLGLVRCLKADKLNAQKNNTEISTLTKEILSKDPKNKEILLLNSK